MNIQDKISIALLRLEHLLLNNSASRVFLGHSGGKDSVVIHDLAQHYFPNIKLVHNVKPMLGTGPNPEDKLTEMYPETLEFLYSTVARNHNIEFFHSSKMLDYLEEHSLTCQIDGARTSEWNRAGKSSNFICAGESINRKHLPLYLKNGLLTDGIFGLDICYPIYDWSDLDVFEYIITKDLPFSKEYLNNGEYNAAKQSLGL